MKIIADESVNFFIVTALRNEGAEIISIAEDYTSMKDIAIASLSLKPPAIIITEDKDFGELVFKDKIHVTAVVLLRYDQIELPVICKRIISLMSGNLMDLENTFTVITFNKTRIRKL